MINRNNCGILSQSCRQRCTRFDLNSINLNNSIIIFLNFSNLANTGYTTFFTSLLRYSESDGCSSSRFHLPLTTSIVANRREIPHSNTWINKIRKPKRRRTESCDHWRWYIMYLMPHPSAGRGIPDSASARWVPHSQW